MFYYPYSAFYYRLSGFSTIIGPASSLNSMRLLYYPLPGFFIILKLLLSSCYYYPLSCFFIILKLLLSSVRLSYYPLSDNFIIPCPASSFLLLYYPLSVFFVILSLVLIILYAGSFYPVCSNWLIYYSVHLSSIFLFIILNPTSLLLLYVLLNAWSLHYPPSGHLDSLKANLLPASTTLKGMSSENWGLGCYTSFESSFQGERVGENKISTFLKGHFTTYIKPPQPTLHSPVTFRWTLPLKQLKLGPC